MMIANALLAAVAVSQTGYNMDNLKWLEGSFSAKRGAGVWNISYSSPSRELVSGMGQYIDATGHLNLNEYYTFEKQGANLVLYIVTGKPSASMKITSFKLGASPAGKLIFETQTVPYPNTIEFTKSTAGFTLVYRGASTVDRANPEGRSEQKEVFNFTRK